MALSALVSLNPFYGTGSHIWSVAVEFQFYLVSPFILHWMTRKKDAWLLPILLAFLSFIVSVYLSIYYCPGLLENKLEGDCVPNLWLYWY